MEAIGLQDGETYLGLLCKCILQTITGADHALDDAAVGTLEP